MDFIDHLIFTTNTKVIRKEKTFNNLSSDNILQIENKLDDKDTDFSGVPFGNPETFSDDLPKLFIENTRYDRNVRENYVLYQDPTVIDKAIQKHWYDMTNGPIKMKVFINKNDNQKTKEVQIFDPKDLPPYHLIYAYLIENTRITQIMERLIYLYQHDEILGITSSESDDHKKAFQWINNTENLFFKTLSNTSYRNITGNLRPNPEASRRNAYFRMFGMDLAFGEPAGSTGTDYSYYKAKTANKEFIILFEQFLTEIWQAYINAKNSSGVNTTDYQRVIDMARKLREMLLARRGASEFINLENYKFMTLSKEEYSSVGFMSWLYFIISYNSPLVKFLGCTANTASERLNNIGKKVGIEAHKKTQDLMDMAGEMATVLRGIEGRLFENTVGPWIRIAIESQAIPANVTENAQIAALKDLLIIINNWERATGHRIKNPEANVTGTVRVQQNGVKGQTAMN